MPKVGSKRKSGPKKKPGTKAEAALVELESRTGPARRRISGKDRRFIQLFADNGFSDAHSAAKEAGFIGQWVADKLLARLHHLIDAERLRRAIGQQMELDEALRLLADLARTSLDQRVQLASVRTVLEFHQAIGAKTMPADSRRTLARQVAELVDKLQLQMRGKTGARARVRAILTADAKGRGQAAVEAEVEAEEELPQLPPAPDSTS